MIRLRHRLKHRMGQYRIASIVCLFLAVCLLSACEEEKKEVLPVKKMSYIDVKEIVLENGLTVLLVPDASASLVSARTYVKAGSIDEAPYLGHGLSHYLEHIVAGGTTSKRSEQAYKDKISLLGGAYNAYTTVDHTSYYINTVPEFTQDAIEVLYEWMFFCSFDQHEYEREKKVITKEIEKNAANIRRKFYYQTQQNFYKYSQLQFPVIGYLEDFKQTPKQALEDYYKERYVPSNMILVVGGDIDVAKVSAFIQDTFGKQPRQAAPPALYEAEPQPFSERRQHYFGKTNSTYLSVRFSSIDMFSDDLYPLDLLDYILGNGENSILNQVFVQEEQLAFGVRTSSNTPSFTTGYFDITFETESKHVDDILKKLEAVIVSIKEGDLTPAQIEKAKKQKLAEDIFSIVSIDEKVARIGQGVLYGQSVHFFEEYVNNFGSVKPRHVVEAAKKYLNFERAVITTLQPEGEQNDEAGVGAPVVGSSPLEPGYISEKPVIKQLPSGPKVIMYHDKSLPRMHAKVAVLGGLRSETPSNNGVSHLLATMLGNGAIGYSKEQLNEMVESRGASMVGASGRNTVYFNLDCLSEDTSELYPVFLHAFFNPEFDSEDLAVEKRKVLQGIEKRQDDWYRISRYHFKKAFFGDHPYAMAVGGEADTVNALGVDDLYTHLSDLKHPEHMVFTIFGDFDEAYVLKEIQTALNKFLGVTSVDQEEQNEQAESGIQEKESVKEPFYLAEPMPRPLHTKSTHQRVKIPQDVAGFFVGFDGTSFSDESLNVKVDLLNSVLAGLSYPGGRLHNELREHGLVYVVQANNLPGMETGCFMIVALTSDDKVKTVEDMVLAQIKSLKEIPISDDEFNHAIAQLKFNYKDRMSTLDGFSLSVATDELYGLGHDNYLEQEAQIGSLTKQDVQDMANKIFVNPQIFIFSSNN